MTREYQLNKLQFLLNVFLVILGMYLALIVMDQSGNSGDKWWFGLTFGFSTIWFLLIIPNESYLYTDSQWVV